MLDRLEAAVDDQRRFVANASHELRSPLTVIRTEADVTLANPDATVAELREMGEVVLEATDRTEALLDGLLVLARSRRPLRRDEAVDLAVLLQRAAAQVAREAAAGSVELRVRAAPAPVRGDAALLERLAANLAENAVRHNVAGGVAELEAGVGADGSARCASPTAGPSSPRRRSAAWPSPSSGSTARRRRRAAGSGSRSSAPSPRRTAARSPCGRGRAAGWSRRSRLPAAGVVARRRRARSRRPWPGAARRRRAAPVTADHGVAVAGGAPLERDAAVRRGARGPRARPVRAGAAAGGPGVAHDALVLGRLEARVEPDHALGAHGDEPGAARERRAEGQPREGRPCRHAPHSRPPSLKGG